MMKAAPLVAERGGDPCRVALMALGRAGPARCAPLPWAVTVECVNA